MEISTDIIKELINSLEAANFDCLRLETADFKLAIERNGRADADVPKSEPAPALNSVTVSVPTSVQNENRNETKEDKEKECKGTVIKSPIVGTFYSSPAPDKPPFVKVGQHVKCGDTLYIVESMKLMNEIASECEGTVAEIYVKDGQPVEYGQPVMRIE